MAQNLALPKLALPRIQVAQKLTLSMGSDHEIIALPEKQ